MNKRTMTAIFLICSLAAIASASVKVTAISGEIKVRCGLDETWKPARTGMLLEDVDTILSGEASRVVLTLPEGVRFSLNSNTILDIGDLRKITERELFLYLTSRKVNRIERSGRDVKIHIENVSVVRGERKEIPSDGVKNGLANMRQFETNGARAMYRQGLFPNAIIKLYTIISKYPEKKNHIEIYYLLGQSFEKVSEPGRALDAYQSALKITEDDNISVSGSLVGRISNAVERLKTL